MINKSCLSKPNRLKHALCYLLFVLQEGRRFPTLFLNLYDDFKEIQKY